jgi:SAM-dependent methyltransferase
MAKQALRSSTEWEQLARQDPLYAVSAWPGKRGRWGADEFYALGRSDWADFARHWRQYWPELGGRCLEIGSGAGRLTHALADDFEEVIGLDVSAEMIELARRVVPQGTRLLQQCEGTIIPLPDGGVDAVFTCHVLQHLDGFSAVRAYIAEAHRVLRAGGSAMIHIPITSRPPSRLRLLYREARLWQVRHLNGRKGGGSMYMRYQAFRHEQILGALKGVGFEDVELRLFPTRSDGNQHAFWLARRGQSAT